MTSYIFALPLPDYRGKESNWYYNRWSEKKLPIYNKKINLFYVQPIWAKIKKGMFYDSPFVPNLPA